MSNGETQTGGSFGRPPLETWEERHFPVEEETRTGAWPQAYRPLRLATHRNSSARLVPDTLDIHGTTWETLAVNNLTGRQFPYTLQHDAIGVYSGETEAVPSHYQAAHSADLSFAGQVLCQAQLVFDSQRQ